MQKAVTKTPKGDVESNNNSPSPDKQQAKIESPSPTPEPLPTPTPVKEKTIEEVEQPEVVETPKVISDTSARRADGSTERTIVREATKEELEEYNRRVEQANRKLESAQEVIEEATKYDDAPVGQEIRDVSEEIRQEMFGDPMTEKERFPFGRPPNAKQHAPSPVPTPTKQTTTQPVLVPEPDVEPTEQPSPTPTPVKQNPPNKDPVEKKLDDLPSLDDIAITVAGLDIIKQIAEKAGSASPVCLAPTLQPSIDRNNTNTGLARAAILGQGQITQNAVNTANATLNHSTWGLQAIVTNTSYGLQKIQGFASTAWKATRADKIVNALNTLLIIHNAMMLSNNIASTTSEALNLGLEALGIRNEEDEPIDIGRAVKNKLTSTLQSWFGEAKYKQLTLRLASANRIYQSGANIVYGIRNVFDAGQYLVENISENVSFIGNALRRDGVVRENSYRLMPTDVKSTSRLLHRLEAANDVVDIIEEIASDAKDITEEISELNENQKQFEEELESAFGDRQSEEISTKSFATSTPEPSEEDEFRGVVDGD